MTREQTVNLIHSIVSLYPNWKPDNLSETVNAWCWALADYPAEQVKAALQIFIKTSNTGFAPNPSQIIHCIHEPIVQGYLTEGEAWALVKKAISDSGYHAEERFAELPPLVQRAVGSAYMLHQWSQTDTDEVNTVIMSNFQRTYKTLIDRQAFNEKVPTALADLVRGISDKVSGQKLIDSVN